MSAISESPRILIVEDDENLRVGLQDNLEEQGYTVAAVADAATARTLLKDQGGERRFELIILDICCRTPTATGFARSCALRENMRGFSC